MTLKLHSLMSSPAWAKTYDKAILMHKLTRDRQTATCHVRSASSGALHAKVLNPSFASRSCSMPESRPFLTIGMTERNRVLTMNPRQLHDPRQCRRSHPPASIQRILVLSYNSNHASCGLTLPTKALCHIRCKDLQHSIFYHPGNIHLGVRTK